MALEKDIIINKFTGYIERDDITNISPTFLVRGSQNVLSTDGKRVANRKGYTLFGSASGALTPIASSFDWQTSLGFFRHMRSFGTSPAAELQALFNGEYETIGNTFLSPDFSYTTVWDTTELRDILVFVNGGTDIFTWSGGMTTFASATTTTITKQGVESLAESGFLQSGTRQIVIGAITYTYTGGEGTTTLTGVTPDPTLGGHVVGDLVYQKIKTQADTPVSDAVYTNTTIAFVNSNPDTITDTAAGFVTAGFVAGDIIRITGSVSNNGTYTIATVVAGTITLIATDVLTVAAAGASVTITAVRTWTNDIVSTLRNQLYVGSYTNRVVYVSQVGNYLNFSPPSVPRVVGQAATLQLDSPPVAFIPQEENMYMSAGMDEWYLIRFTLSADLADETLTVDRLKTATQQAANNQFSVFKMKNDVMFISQEPTLDSLGRLQLVQTPQSKPISDPVKLLFDRLDFTGCVGIYKNDFIYISVPAEGLVLIYNVIEGYWEAPQVLPVRFFSIIDGILYGHSSQVPETYKLFEGYNDNTQPILSIAAFAYMNGSVRDKLKNHDEWYTEGYINPSTTLTLTLNYDYTGYTAQRSFDISGSDQGIIFNATIDGSLGKNSLGKLNLAGFINLEGDDLPPKFRVINTMNESGVDYFEIQGVYSTNQVDAQWELLAYGPNMHASKADPFQIKR